MLKAYGVTHCSSWTRSSARTGGNGGRRIKRILGHSEKAVAYMADGFAACRPPGVCMAQSVGAANLASGMQDPYSVIHR